MLRTKIWVDVHDLPDAARDAYRDLVQSAGIHNGEGFPWCVGELESMPESYIGQEKCDLIDNALREFGAEEMQDIELVYGW